MRIFIAGATGAVGKRLVPLLGASGHEVVGTTRSAGKDGALRALGAEPVVLDVLDAAGGRPSRLRGAAGRRRAPGNRAVRHSGTCATSTRTFAETNRLRTEGTDNLLAARRRRREDVRRPELRRLAVRERRLRRQDRGGAARSDPAGERRAEHGGDPSPRDHGRRRRGIEGIVLRYGGFYGPGTSLVEGGEHVAAIRKRQFPIVGSGAGVWSFVHIDDAAGATLAAIERGRPGLYNIVDDEPAPTSEWLPYAGRGARCEAAPSCAGVARPARRRRAGRLDDDRGAWRVEREGEARARVDARPPDLARRLRRAL